MLLSQILETWQKMLRNPWAQLISAGHLWPHKISGLFLSCIYLILVRLCLGARLFQRWGHKVPPLGLSEQIICPSCLIGLLFCWIFLFVLGEMVTFLTAHSSAAAAPACILWSWRPVAVSEGGRQVEGLARMESLALRIFTTFRKRIYSRFTPSPSGSLRHQ